MPIQLFNWHLCLTHENLISQVQLLFPLFTSDILAFLLFHKMPEIFLTVFFFFFFFFNICCSHCLGLPSLTYSFHSDSCHLLQEAFPNHLRYKSTPYYSTPSFQPCSVYLTVLSLVFYLKRHTRGHMYTYDWFMLMFDRKQQNSVKQLSFN